MQIKQSIIYRKSGEFMIFKGLNICMALLCFLLLDAAADTACAMMGPQTQTYSYTTAGNGDEMQFSKGMLNAARVKYSTKRISVFGKDIYLSSSFAGGISGMDSPSTVSEGEKIQFRLSGGLLEYYSTVAGGLEQGWTLESAPSQDGTTNDLSEGLLVEVKIDTGLTPAVIGDAVIFLSENEEPVSSYSNIYAFDAKGKGITIVPSLSGDIISMEVPAQWLADAAYPVTLDPLVGSESSVNLGPFHAMTSGWRYGSSDTGANFFVAGEKDARAGGWGGDILSPTLSSSGSFSSGATIFGDVEHHVTQPQGLAVGSPLSGGVRIELFNDSGSSIRSLSISTESGYLSCKPSVYSNSTHYLVVWDERRLASNAKNKKCGGSDASPVRGSIMNTFPQDYVEANIYGALIDLNGNMVGSKIAIARISGVIQVAPGVSSGYTATNTSYPYRDDFFVTWSRFTSDGVPATLPDGVGSPSSVQSEFPVLYGTRIDASGAVLDGVNGKRLMEADGPNEIVFTKPQWDPRVSFSTHPDGDHFLVVWDEGSLAGFALPGDNAIHAARIQITDTTFINYDPKGVPVGRFPGSGAFDPDVVWNGDYYYVVWQDIRNDSSVRSHTFSSSPPTSSNNNSGNNSGGLSGLDLDIYGTRVKSSLVTGIEALEPEGTLLHRDSGSPDYFPEVAWNGTNHAVFWTDHMVERWRGPKAKARLFNFYYNIQPSTLPQAKVGEPYEVLLAVSECFRAPNTDCATDSFTWSVESTDWDINGSSNDNSLSSTGLSLDSATGIISGAPAQSNEGVYYLRVRADNIATSDYDYREYRLIVGEPVEALTTGCWIATAAYGSYLDPYVVLLRDMRDRYLLPYSYGKKIMRLYYDYSPPIAGFIAKHSPVKVAVRIMLLPIIFIAAFMVKLSGIQKLIFIVSFLIILFLNRFTLGYSNRL